MTDLIVTRGGDLIETASATFGPELDEAGRHVYRYALTRRWASGPHLVFVMLNPSTADAYVLDPTVTRCRSRAQALGYTGVTVLNAFALRATQPSALRHHPDPIGPANDRTLVEESRRGDGRVIVAWGVHAVLDDRHKAVAKLLAAVGIETWCLGVTKDGHPRHPLYVPSAAQLTRWAP